jgi:hypothetical protein
MTRLLKTALYTSTAFVTVLNLAPALSAQSEGLVPTQVLVSVDAKSNPPALSDLTVQVGGHKEPLTAWTAVAPNGVQVALLIDSGLRESVGRELNTLRSFVQNLPAGTEIFIGYMQSGTIVPATQFTTDRAAAAQTLHLPEGMPGASASPYFCLSDFVKNWPSIARGSSSSASDAGVFRGGQPIDPIAGAPRKARFVFMITNGVDPYNGSTSVLNQDSPYVAAAVTDSQRAGVAVYSVYYGDAGFRGNRGSFSGQSYLAQVSDGTGGAAYYEGSGNPVSLAPYLKSFQKAIDETYIATFNAPAASNAGELLKLKIATSNKAKLHAPDEIHPGNVE